MNTLGLLFELVANLTALAEEANSKHSLAQDELASAMRQEIERARIALGELDATHAKNRADADALLLASQKKETT